MTTDLEGFHKFLDEMAEEANKYQTCMALNISEDGLFVDLCLDTGRSYYGSWIEGEGGDITLLRDSETDKVIGCHLPLMNRRLAISYDGPIKINEGFLRDDRTDSTQVVERTFETEHESKGKPPHRGRQ